MLCVPIRRITNDEIRPPPSSPAAEANSQCKIFRESDNLCHILRRIPHMQLFTAELDSAFNILKYLQTGFF